MEENEIVTPCTYGEMYVRRQLLDGLFQNELMPMIKYRTNDSGERMMLVNDVAREVGEIMMPYLASNCDVGFESFQNSIKDMAKTGTIYYYHEELHGKLPYIQMMDVVDVACVMSGDQVPEEILIYARLSPSQHMLLSQYRDMNIHFAEHFEGNHPNLCIDYSAEFPADINEIKGYIHVWLGKGHA